MAVSTLMTCMTTVWHFNKNIMQERYIPKYSFFKRFFGHLHNILEHKCVVFKWCCKFGIPLQGIAHDISKFCPVEFWEGVKYYQGGSSPIPVCKKWNNGYSRAWQHHRRALHHYEAWTDNYDFGVVAHMMPYRYALEMLADWLAAGETYAKSFKKTFCVNDEINWWNKTKENKHAMHPALKQFAEEALTMLVKEKFKNSKELQRNLKETYQKVVSSNDMRPYSFYKDYKD